MAMWESKEVILSFGDNRITAKDCSVQSFNIKRSMDTPNQIMLRSGKLVDFQSCEAPVEIQIELLCDPNKFNFENWDGDYSPKISKKLVDDCSIQELLFAVREKIKGEKNGNEN